jgi:hypothetical protein
VRLESVDEHGTVAQQFSCKVDKDRRELLF